MVTCPNGHVQPEGVRFCGLCGVPLTADPTLVVPVTEPTPTPTGGSNRGVAVGVGIGIAAVLVVIVGVLAAIALTGNDGDDTETAQLEDDLADLEERLDEAKGSTSTAAPTTAAPTTPPPTAPATTSRAATTAPATLPPAAPPPASSGTWITVLASIGNDDPVGAQEKLDELSGLSAGVTWLDSDAYASLAPGLYVIYDGPYSSGGEALARCYALGRSTRNLCFAAPVSQDSDDRNLRLYPD